MPTYFDLKRRFVERTKYDPEELLASEISGRRLGWDEVLAEFISVVVAPANYGKTTEMRERAAALRTSSAAAVFVALRKVADRGSFEKALEPADRSAYETWRAAPTVLLTLFVDSLDEGSSSSRDGIEYLLGEVAREVGWPSDRIRWVISTRPAVLSASVLETLSSLLVVPYVATVTAVPVTVPTAATSSTNASVSSASQTEPVRLRVFSLVHLDSEQAKTYLAGKYPSLQPAELLRLARERGLSGFTTSPGGLDVLANMGLLASPPESLTEVYQRVVDVVQERQRTDARIEAAGGAKPHDLAEAARKLAAASQVCRLPNIELFDETVVIPEGVLAARNIAGDLLPDRVLRQLLSTQLFIDAGFNQVKLYPDEILPFLGAQRLAGLVQSPELANRLIEHFTWSASTGEHGVYRHFLPLMGWLATLNQHCREELLAREPQALAFFGDLRNKHVPLSAARAALRASIRRLVEQGDRLGRGMFALTSENFWQAGPAHLTTVLKELFQRYGSNNRARDALLDIATSSRSAALRKFVLKDCGKSYERLLHRTIDLRYILELGDPQDLAGLAAALKADDTANERVVATLMVRLGWSHLTATEIAALVNRQFGSGRAGFHASYAFDAGLVEQASDDQLYELCRALVLHLGRLRDRKECLVGERGRADERYVELVTETLAALVGRTSFTKHRRVALLCLLMQRILSDGHIGSDDTMDLRQALRANEAVRFELLSLNIKRAGTDENKLWSAAYGHEALSEVTPADVEALNSAELNAVVKEHENVQAAHRAKPQPTRRTKEDGLKVSDQAKQALLGMLETMRDGTGTNGLAWVAAWLLQTNPRSRYGEVNFEVFEQQAGTAIAQAVRDGLAKVWRTRLPMAKEDKPRTTYHITVAGLQGLHLELGEGKDLPNLTRNEVRNALQYAVFEINGYPKWFWPLVTAHQDVASKELARIVANADAGAVSVEHAEGLLTALGDAPPDIQRSLAPQAWAFIQKRPKLGVYVVEKLVSVATDVPGVVSQREYETTAWSKIRSAFAGSLPTDAEEAKAVQAARKQSAVWATGWLTRYPASFRKTVERWLTKTPADGRAFIFTLAAHLGMERGARLVHLAETSDDGVTALAALYEWTAAAVRPEDDHDHTDGEVYSPDDRDHAERLRDALIPAIAAAKSQLAYDALGRLRVRTDGPRSTYLRHIQFEMREAQYARPALEQHKYNDFERGFIADVTDTTSFAMTVHSDLLSLKYDVEHGEYSLRRFFTEVVLKRPKNKLRQENEGLALEAEFQRLLASELHHHSKGRYSVTVEPHTAEAKRRDVLCSKGDMFASIELKMSMRWTLDKYVEALEKQLVGQYMRHRKATAGFLVIVLQEKNRIWNNPATGGKVDFKGLLAILSEKATALEAKNRSHYIRVIGIDANQPENFRTAGKTGAPRTLPANTARKAAGAAKRATPPAAKASVTATKTRAAAAGAKVRKTPAPRKSATQNDVVRGK